MSNSCVNISENVTDEVIETLWDAIVIGTGIGGALVGADLINSGKRVLFIEKGPSSTLDELRSHSKLPLWSEKIVDEFKGSEFSPFLGEGVGGSSRLYGMVMERLEPSDFQDQGGSWPGSVSLWENYYQLAEKRLNVQKAKYSDQFDVLTESLNKKGVMTYPLSLSYKGKENCNFCQSRICDRECKIDAWSGPLSEALRSELAFLLCSSSVDKVILREDVAVGVQVGDSQIFAKNVILAAGALQTPYILNRTFQSLGSLEYLRWPALGRYLMRHFVDLYVLKWPDCKATVGQKAIGISDFYVDPKTREKLGVFQSFGFLAEFSVVYEEIISTYPFLSHIPWNRYFAHKVVKSIFNNPIIGSIIEDSPSFENRLNFDTNKKSLFYAVAKKDEIKISRSREIAKSIFSPFLKKILKEAHNNKRLAHVCGTCRMGDDVNTSVVNWNCQVHELGNLYVVDSSVFPSSTGKNPSLSIAANALRVSENIKRGL